MQFWIPQDVSNPLVSVIITTASGDTYDITNFLHAPIVVTNHSLLYGMDTAQVILDNGGGRYIHKDTGEPIFEGGDTITINIDYDSSTTRLFKGKIYDPQTIMTGTHQMRIFARKVPELRDKILKRQYTNQQIVSVIQTILDEDFSDLVTHNNFDENLGDQTNTVSVTYSTNTVNIIADLFRRAGWDGYWDNDPTDTGKFDLIAFKKNTEVNVDVALVEGQNLLSIQNFGINTDKVFNNIILSGKQLGGSSILRNQQNSNSINSLWKRDLQVTDNNLTTMPEANERVSFELSLRSNRQKEGTLVAIGDPNIVPAKLIKCSSQWAGMFGNFVPSRIVHNFAQTWKMTVSIEEPLRLISDIFKDQRDESERLRQFDNPNDMKQSYNFTFDNSNNIESFPDMQVINGNLKMDDGIQTAIMVSKTLTLLEDVTQFDYILENPVHFDLSKIEVSNDGGATFTEQENENIVTNFPVTAKRIKVRITLTRGDNSNQDPELGGIVIRMK